MKPIFSAKVSENLIPQGFSDIEKERKLQYQWYHNFRSYLVEARGIEPLSENRPIPLSTDIALYLNSLEQAL